MPRKGEPDMTTFGGRLEAARRRRLLTRIDVADKIGVDPRMIERWENNRAMPRLSTVATFCEVLDVEPGVLMDAPKGEG